MWGTNREYMDASNASSTTYSLPYIYDNFSWKHCSSEGGGDDDDSDVDAVLEAFYYLNSKWSSKLELWRGTILDIPKNESPNGCAELHHWSPWMTDETLLIDNYYMRRLMQPTCCCRCALLCFPLKCWIIGGETKLWLWGWLLRISFLTIMDPCRVNDCFLIGIYESSQCIASSQCNPLESLERNDRSIPQPTTPSPSGIAIRDWKHRWLFVREKGDENLLKWDPHPQFNQRLMCIGRNRVYCCL